MKLINIGYGSYVVAERIMSLIAPDSAPIKRMIQDAREKGRLIDASFGRSTRTVVFLDNGFILLSAMEPENMAAQMD
jgi:regulator of extracellular matrix RemA (YlzA/DUF370 family)